MLSVDRPLETERLVLRAFRPDDLDDLHELQADPDVVRYLYWEVRTREESRAWLEIRMAASRLEKDDDAVAYAVERRSDGKVLGSITLFWRSVQHRQGQIGFVLLPSAQGQGYAHEAASAVLDEAFRVLELHRVCGITDPRNTPSAGLLRRLGMRQEAHLREDQVFKGEWGDQLVFAVPRREWEAARR